MELWELNLCIKVYNKKQEDKDREILTACWTTAALSGASFAGKLKKLKHYINEDHATEGQQLTPEQVAELEKKIAERRRKDVV